MNEFYNYVRGYHILVYNFYSHSRCSQTTFEVANVPAVVYESEILLHVV